MASAAERKAEALRKKNLRLQTKRRGIVNRGLIKARLGKEAGFEGGATLKKVEGRDTLVSVKDPSQQVDREKARLRERGIKRRTSIRKGIAAEAGLEPGAEAIIRRVDGADVTTRIDPKTGRPDRRTTGSVDVSNLPTITREEQAAQDRGRLEDSIPTLDQFTPEGESTDFEAFANALLAFENRRLELGKKNVASAEAEAAAEAEAGQRGQDTQRDGEGAAPGEFEFEESPSRTSLREEFLKQEEEASEEKRSSLERKLDEQIAAEKTRQKEEIQQIQRETRQRAAQFTTSGRGDGLVSNRGLADAITQGGIKEIDRLMRNGELTLDKLVNERDELLSEFDDDTAAAVDQKIDDLLKDHEKEQGRRFDLWKENNRQFNEDRKEERLFAVEDRMERQFSFNINKDINAQLTREYNAKTSRLGVERTFINDLMNKYGSDVAGGMYIEYAKEFGFDFPQSFLDLETNQERKAAIEQISQFAKLPAPAREAWSLTQDWQDQQKWLQLNEGIILDVLETEERKFSEKVRFEEEKKRIKGGAGGSIFTDDEKSTLTPTMLEGLRRGWSTAKFMEELGGVFTTTKGKKETISDAYSTASLNMQRELSQSGGGFLPSQLSADVQKVLEARSLLPPDNGDDSDEKSFEFSDVSFATEGLEFPE